MNTIMNETYLRIVNKFKLICFKKPEEDLYYEDMVLLKADVANLLFTHFAEREENQLTKEQKQFLLDMQVVLHIKIKNCNNKSKE